MACIAKRRGRYVLDYYDNRGKRRWQTLPKGTSLKQAKAELRAVENQLAKGVFISAKDVPSFKKAAEDWLIFKKANVRASTWDMYNSHLNNHFGMINDMNLNKITIATVEKFIAARKQNGVKLGTLRKILITFGQVMKYAVRHRLIEYNPVSEAERPRDQGEEEESGIWVLTPEEITAFLDAESDEEYHTFFMMAITSGARLGELCGLKWSDIIWETNQVHIQRTFNNKAWYKPKSKSSIRKIDLGPATIKQLKKWKLACPPTKLDLIFPGKAGGPLYHKDIYRCHFWPALEGAGLPRMKFHNLRHTYASLLIEQGENIKYIQKQLGHSKPTVTLDIYAHLFNEENPDSAKRLEEHIFNHGSKMVASS